MKFVKAPLFLAATLVLANCMDGQVSQSMQRQGSIFVAQPTFSTSNYNKPTSYNASSGQWRTLQNGCSYSRAQAPGYAPTWHLIVNPQQAGLPGGSTMHCAPMVN